jgi:hypothetical protein
VENGCAKEKMRKYLALVMVAVLVSAFIICETPSDKVSPGAGDSMSTLLEEVPLSLDRLPAGGYLILDPGNSEELDRLGLGGPSPANAPPYTPYCKSGIYWSAPFSLVEGDIVEIVVYSDSPVSWFGVDWSNYDVRGVLATTAVDEDGRAFDPQYPTQSFLNKDAEGYQLMVIYKVQYDTDCVLVIKNSSPDIARRLSLSVSLQPSITLKRIAKSIPILKNYVSSSQDSGE